MLIDFPMIDFNSIPIVQPCKVMMQSETNSHLTNLTDPTLKGGQIRCGHPTPTVKSPRKAR